MKKFRIKKDDFVEVISGDDKGKRGKVLKILPKRDAVVVEGCKLAKKSVKPTDKNPKGGFVNIEMPIHISNVRKVEEGGES
jgi:large subunit ribosomal protein L24